MQKILSKGLAGLALAALTLLPTAHAATDYNGDASFYNVGFGACGKTNDNTQLVAAISKAVFDSVPSASTISNKFCGKKAKIINGKKSVVVTVVDRCATCGKEDIALSPAAFKKIASMDAGKVPVKWKLIP